MILAAAVSVQRRCSEEADPHRRRDLLRLLLASTSLRVPLCAGDFTTFIHFISSALGMSDRELQSAGAWRGLRGAAAGVLLLYGSRST